jgi:hypothetical protein
MAFQDFLASIGKVVTPPKRIREWRQLKRQYRRYLQGLGQDASAVRQGVRAWMKLHPKPKKTKGEREQSLSDIPQIFEEGKELFGGNGVRGVDSATFTGVTTPPTRTAGLNPLLLLLLVPLVFPKQIKKFFNV